MTGIVLLAIAIAALLAYAAVTTLTRGIGIGRRELPRRADPFAEPFGEVLDRARWLEGEGEPVIAERSLAERGIGFSAHQLRQFRGAPHSPAVREGSSGAIRSASRVAAAARLPVVGAVRDGARCSASRLLGHGWSWGKRRAF